MVTRSDIDGLGDSKLISTCDNNPRFQFQVERVRSWEEFQLGRDLTIGLYTAIFLIARGAVVEMMP